MKSVRTFRSPLAAGLLPTAIRSAAPRLLSFVCLLITVAAAPLLASSQASVFKRSVGLDADVLPGVPGVQRVHVQLGLHGEGWRVEGIRTAGLSLSALHDAQALNPRRVGVEWTCATEPFHHFAFVFADIDADSDLDVIVVNTHKGTAESVWRNHGAGRLERLTGHRYGTIRFPSHRITGAGTTAASGALLAAGAAFPLLNLSTSTALREHVDMALGTSSLTPASVNTGATPGRGPPRLV